MADTQALSAEFRKYDQVEKAHTYRLAEHASDQFDDDYEIAKLDIAPFLTGDAVAKADFAKAFASALEEIGFAVLVGHGIDVSLYDEMDAQVLELFESTPLEQKMRFAAERYGSVAQGYFPIEQTSEIHPDLVEGWVFCRRAFDIPQQRDAAFCAEDFWPRQEFERQFRRLILAHEAAVQADRAGDAPRTGLRSAPARREAHRHEFRSQAELLSADERGAGQLRRGAAARA